MNFSDALAGVLGLDANPVANLEVVGVHKGDFLVKPVSVFRQSGERGSFFGDHGVRSAALDADVALKINGVAKAVGAGKDFDRSPSPARHGVNGRLDHLFIGTDQVSLVRADSKGEPLRPVRFDGIARGGARNLDGNCVFAGAGGGAQGSASESDAAEGLSYKIAAIHGSTSGRFIVGIRGKSMPIKRRVPSQLIPYTGMKGWWLHRGAWFGALLSE